MEEYPDSFLRGILSDDAQWCIDGIVTPALFNFTRNDRGGMELSINWYDCEAALLNLSMKLNEKKGGIEYKGGVAQVKREHLDRLKLNSKYRGRIDYERCRLPDNEHHGNILFLNKEPSEKRVNLLHRMLCNQLAINAEILKPD